MTDALVAFPSLDTYNNKSVKESIVFTSDPVKLEDPSKIKSDTLQSTRLRRSDDVERDREGGGNKSSHRRRGGRGRSAGTGAGGGKGTAAESETPRSDIIGKTIHINVKKPTTAAKPTVAASTLQSTTIQSDQNESNVESNRLHSRRTQRASVDQISDNPMSRADGDWKRDKLGIETAVQGGGRGRGEGRERRERSRDLHPRRGPPAKLLDSTTTGSTAA